MSTGDDRNDDPQAGDGFGVHAAPSICARIAAAITKITAIEILATSQPTMLTNLDRPLLANSATPETSGAEKSSNPPATANRSSGEGVRATIATKPQMPATNHNSVFKLN